jgi:hypothetical protein
MQSMKSGMGRYFFSSLLALSENSARFFGLARARVAGQVDLGQWRMQA